MYLKKYQLNKIFLRKYRLFSACFKLYKIIFNMLKCKKKEIENIILLQCESLKIDTQEITKKMFEIFI